MSEKYEETNLPTMSVISSASEEGKEYIRGLVKEWIQLDRDIKKKTKRRKEVAALLAPVMQQNNLGECNLKNENAVVKHRIQTTRQCLSKKFLIDTLSQYYGDEPPPDKAQQIVEFIMNARQSKNVSKIEGKHFDPIANDEAAAASVN